MKTKTNTKNKTRISEVMLTCRMSKTTFDKINKAARFAALTRSDYVRHVLEKSMRDSELGKPVETK